MEGISSPTASSRETPFESKGVGVLPRSAGACWRRVPLEGTQGLVAGWAFAVERRPELTAYAVVDLVDLAVTRTGAGPQRPFCIALPWHHHSGITEGLNYVPNPGPVAAQCDLGELSLAEWGRQRDDAIAKRQHLTPERFREIQRAIREARAERDRRMAENIGGSEPARKSRDYYAREYEKVIPKIWAGHQPTRPATQLSSLRKQLKRQRRLFARQGILPWAAFVDGDLPDDWGQDPRFVACFEAWADTAAPYPVSMRQEPSPPPLPAWFDPWEFYSGLVARIEAREAKARRAEP